MSARGCAGVRGFLPAHSFRDLQNHVSAGQIPCAGVRGLILALITTFVQVTALRACAAAYISRAPAHPSRARAEPAHCPPFGALFFVNPVTSQMKGT